MRLLEEVRELVDQAEQVSKERKEDLKALDVLTTTGKDIVGLPVKIDIKRLRGVLKGIDDKHTQKFLKKAIALSKKDLEALQVYHDAGEVAVGAVDRSDSLQFPARYVSLK